MTVARRLVALETSLSPTQRVLVWLDQAHAFGSLDAYVNSLLDHPEAFPLDQLAREASASVQTSLRGKPAAQLDAALRKALRETVFRFELVMRINLVAHEVLEKDRLVDAALGAHLALLASEDPEARSDESHRRRLTLMRDALLGRVAELEAIAEAGRLSEERYLDGHQVLFPNAVEAWDEQLQGTRQLAAMAIRLGELDGIGLPESDDQDAISARVAARLADLIEPAKSTALEKLGEVERAMRVATSWLRAKVDAPGPEPGPTE